MSFNGDGQDEQDGPLTPTCEPASGSIFPVGSTQVNCSVKDSGILEASGFFSVTVVDTTAPVIDPHGNVTAEATGPDGANVTYTAPETSDAVDGNGTAICTPASGSKFPLGETTVTCNATDGSGNDATPTTFKVNVADTTAPTLDSHADVSATATSSAGAVVNYTTPSATDAVDSNPTVTCSPAPGATFPIGTTRSAATPRTARATTLRPRPSR